MRTYTIGNTYVEIGQTTVDINQQFSNLFGTITSVRPDLARGCEEKLYYEFWHDLALKLCPDINIAGLDMDETKSLVEDKVLYIPIYYHTDGNYLFINTSLCEETFYSGEFGYAWITKEEVKEIFNVKRLSSKLKVQVYNMLETAVSEYVSLLEGSAFYCSVYNDIEIIDCEECFIGTNMFKNGMYQFLKQYIPDIKKYISPDGQLYSNYLIQPKQNAL